MTKKQTGTQATKKPKKVHVPNPPGLPANLAQVAANALRPRKR
jgi:hypothetical protein